MFSACLIQIFLQSNLAMQGPTVSLGLLEVNDLVPSLEGLLVEALFAVDFRVDKTVQHSTGPFSGVLKAELHDRFVDGKDEGSQHLLWGHVLPPSFPFSGREGKLEIVEAYCEDHRREWVTA